jgi:hypothetical protein
MGNQRLGTATREILLIIARELQESAVVFSTAGLYSQIERKIKPFVDTGDIDEAFYNKLMENIGDFSNLF